MRQGGTKPELEIIVDEGCPLHPDISVEQLTSQSEAALLLCLESRGPHEAQLPDLPEVGIVLMSDETIARIHGEFMDDPTPTDVITFHHGEILVSVDTAVAVAQEMQHSAGRETLLYIIHGLLHLNGHHDYEEKEREAMHAIQDSILDKILPSNASE